MEEDKLPILIRWSMIIMFVVLCVLYGTAEANDHTPQDCIKKHERRVLRLDPKTIIATEVATSVCKHLSPIWRDYIIAIGSIESNMKQVNNLASMDFGVFQINIGEIKRNGYFMEMIETSIEYQVLVAREVLRRKWRECGKLYPDTWQACYNTSNRDKNGVDIHMVYYRKFITAYNKIRRLP